MNPRFETINGQICMMLEKPIPLTKDAKFPCVVRLIQDDSPMGRYNNRLTDKCLLPFICVGIDNNGDMERMENAPRFSHECYELLGYPVAEGSAEWAVWQMLQGKNIVLGNGSVKHSHIRYMKNHAVFCSACGQLTLDINDWLLSAAKSGWQLYEPKPAKEPEPPFAKVMVGDWVECNGNQRLIEIIGRDLGRGNYYHFAHGFGGAYANSITRILKPEEVKVKISLEGTVRSSINDCCFDLSTPNGGWATIGYNEIDPATADLVRDLIAKQEDNNG